VQTVVEYSRVKELICRPLSWDGKRVREKLEGYLVIESDHPWIWYTGKAVMLDFRPRSWTSAV
jgi:hypothetical protein